MKKSSSIGPVLLFAGVILASGAVNAAVRPASSDRPHNADEAQSDVHREFAATRGPAELASNYTPAVQGESARAPYSQALPLSTNVVTAVATSDESTDPALAGQDLWARIRQDYAMQDLDGATVDKQIAFYAARPQIIERTSLRGSKYLYHVVYELERRHMPGELALLPFVESSFDPNAVSSAKASGLWQFIPSTAQMFRLKLNLFRDERRDIVASTDAALSYLEKLHETFGDWQLALAAYNWGDGALRKAIEKNRAAGLPTDYASLAPLMPAETRNYVPRLQAVKAIIAEPERFGVKLPSVGDEPYFTQVSKVPKIEIKDAAQLANMSVAEFRALNPQFNGNVITGRNPTILLPAAKAATFKSNLQRWGQELTAWTVHKVQSAREGVEAIARRFHSTPEAIREANHIPQKMQVLAGSTILVPQASSAVGAPTISDEPSDDAKLVLAAERDVKKFAHRKSRYPHKKAPHR